jgi:uncharacterized membrane protein YkvI
MNAEKINTITRYATYVFMVLAILFEAAIIYYGDKEFAANSDVQNTWLSPFFSVSYVALIIPTFLALVFPIVHIIDDPKQAKGVLIGIGSLAGLILVSYLLAPSEVDPSYPSGVTEVTSKWVSTGIISFYILSIAAIAAVIYAEVSKAIR